MIGAFVMGALDTGAVVIGANVAMTGESEGARVDLTGDNDGEMLEVTNGFAKKKR